MVELMDTLAMRREDGDADKVVSGVCCSGMDAVYEDCDQMRADSPGESTTLTKSWNTNFIKFLPI